LTWLVNSRLKIIMAEFIVCLVAMAGFVVFVCYQANRQIASRNDVQYCGLWYSTSQI
jgi:hypothetical protein